MEDPTTILLALAAHFVLCAIAGTIIIRADIVEKEQKWAQILICLLVPFAASVLISAFTLSEQSASDKSSRVSGAASATGVIGNDTQIKDSDGIGLHIAQQQHNSVSSSESSE